MLLLLVLVTLSCSGGIPISQQRLDVRNHLKRLNKPAVKSIKVASFFLSFFFAFYGVLSFFLWFFCLSDDWSFTYFFFSCG